MVNRAVARRLLTHAAGARGYLIAAGLCGLAVTGLILAQAQLLARALAGAATGAAATIALRGTLLALLAVVIARAVAVHAGEATALRGAVAIKERLRSRLARHVLTLGPSWLGRQRPGEIATLGTSGLASLDPYFARYLPQVVLAGAVPVAVVPDDPIAADHSSPRSPPLSGQFGTSRPAWRSIVPEPLPLGLLRGSLGSRMLQVTAMWPFTRDRPCSLS